MTIFIQNPALLPKVRSRALLDAAKDMPCTLRIASFLPGGKCSPQPTVVPCHIKSVGKGMGSKSSDLHVAAGCQACHDILDWRDKHGAEYIADRYAAALAWQVVNAIYETQHRWVEAGLIEVPGAEILK
ncbi:MAG: hypothetical protein DI533_00250 [Cereibacter sphaeroides]|uniref:DUF1364 domain-containing protein n=1 Tax=Cereibacter sphaeroides TaxID=1063 RepID=A0A2W5SHC7_CERSP|nr:MAG: hypothetical protein DI533_00250 [Cereibacter sphaeroides]